MRGIWTGLKLDFKQIVSGYIKLILFSLSMVILCLAIGIAGNNILYGEKTVEPFGLAIVDKEDSEWTHMIIDAVKQMETVTRLCQIEITDEQDAKAKLEKGEVVAIITIPDHFVVDVMTGENTPLIVEKNEGTILESIVVDKLITASTKLLSAAQVGIYTTLAHCKLYGNASDKEYNMLLQEINLIFAKKMLSRNQMFLEKEVVATGNISTVAHYLLSGFIVMMMLSLMLVMQIIEPLNKAEMLMRYKVTKIRGSKIILQKWISLWFFYLIFGGVSLGGIIICTQQKTFLMNWEISGTGAIGFLVITATLAAIGLLIGMLLEGKEAYGLFIFMIALVQAFLAGGIVPSAFLPEAINQLGYLTYNKYAVHILGSLLGEKTQLSYYYGISIVLVLCLIGCHIIIKKRGIRL